MPSINASIQPNGPLLSCLIGLSLPRVQALMAANQVVPPGVIGTFLIDTGASCTCVDPDFIKPLGLQPTGRTNIMTPSTQPGTPHSCEQFDISLFIPDGAQGGHLVGALPIITTHLRSQGIEGLIGRDVLNACTLIYNGSAGIVTLAY